MKYKSFQVVVVGSGVAGLTAAINLAQKHIDVAIVTKDTLADSATNIAQGGIAAVMEQNGDRKEIHLSDTLSAGAGLCDVETVRVLVTEGPKRVRDLIQLGAHFDTDASGHLAKGREGGHSFARVVHAGGAATGREVESSLIRFLASLRVEVLENYFATDLLYTTSGITGLMAVDALGEMTNISADYVILATGGAGQMFPLTTAPHQSTGDGLAMALRAGAACADLEFVQFHPTALAVKGQPKPLISEAVRGEGGLLLDHSGKRFVDELLPRDVVSKKMAEKMAEEKSTELFLDVRNVENFASKFPNLDEIVKKEGFDPGVDLLPVAPAAHYLCGGVLADPDGFSSLPGLCAVGEVACNGVHGANRLASNSLLDGLVSGKRVAERIATGVKKASPNGVFAFYAEESLSNQVMLEQSANDHIPLLYLGDMTSPDLAGRIGKKFHAEAREDFLSTFYLTTGRYLAMSRSSEGLLEAEKQLNELSELLPEAFGRKDAEMANMILIAKALIASAERRRESRGAHIREEFPDSDERYRVRLVHGAKEMLSAI